MKLIKPTDITADKLISSNVPEDDYAAWSSTSTYVKGNRVILDHQIWQAAGDVPAGTKPGEETPAEDEAYKWVLIGATNRWRMFDDKVESLTTRAGTIEVRLRPGAVVNSLAMFNVSARTVRVRMVDPVEGTVYDKTTTLVDYGVTNWYDYFFLPVSMLSDLVILDLPTYGTADIYVTIDAGSATAAVGHLTVGAQTQIGEALYGSSVGINDYSKKTTDDFGNTTVVKRSYSKRAEFDIWLDTVDVTRIYRLLAELRATPVVWIGEESYEATILFGYYRNFNIVYSGPEVSDGSLTVEAVI